MVKLSLDFTKYLRHWHSGDREYCLRMFAGTFPSQDITDENLDTKLADLEAYAEQAKAGGETCFPQ